MEAEARPGGYLGQRWDWCVGSGVEEGKKQELSQRDVACSGESNVGGFCDHLSHAPQCAHVPVNP